ncbi:MAG: glycosyltransferase family 4 protein [Saprospiraceae bacterium]|nr:glycosyltransferase family 4 protein [Saprospiraceae bacterium]MDW8230337.1 glycosyltransferase family 4 protein [Saprospiraceae bacterium]
MRVLQLCKKYPYPIKDGESVAIVYLSRALQQCGCTVSLLAMNTRRHWYGGGGPPEALEHYERVHAVAVDNRIRLWSAVRNLFSGRSYHVERFVSEAFARRLAEILQQETFDVVLLETIYLTPYVPLIREHSRACVALRTHNVESEIWERIAAHSGFAKRQYLRLQAQRLKRFEQAHLHDGDIVVGISERDVATFRAWGLQKPAVVVPIGVDMAAYVPDENSFEQPLSLCFIGSLDWQPNLEGLQWFLDEVWAPLLAPAFPELTLHIAGRNTPAWMRQLHLPRVHVHGEVPDAAVFLNAHPVLVVPLLSGGGMRAKIVEAMALGRVVISTSVGLEGIPARHGAEVLVADDALAFAEAVRFCLEQANQLVHIGRRARAFCEAQFDHIHVAEQLLEAFQAEIKK